MVAVAKFISTLSEELDRDLAARGRAQVAGLKTATRGLEKDLEGAAAGDGLGRLARAYGSKVFPDRSSTGSLSAAGVVFVKGSEHTQHAVHAFTHGATVRSGNGLFLLVPTENAPKVGLGRDRDKRLAAAEARYGKLRFVYRRGKPSLLVADSVRARSGKRGGFAKASVKATAAGNVATVVIFFLVPLATIRKRYDIGPFEARWRAQLPALINAEYERINRG